VRHYKGPTGKLTAAWGLLRGTLSAIPMLPGMLRKRRVLRSKRKLSSSEMRRLLLAHRIPLKELSEHAS
jgi:hypothetical protein